MSLLPLLLEGGDTGEGTTHRTMKKPLLKLLFLFGIISVHTASQAQEINFEFAAPIDKIVKTFGASAIQDTLQIGVASVKITDDRIGKFRQVAPPNLLLIFEQLDNPTKVRELVQAGNGNLEKSGFAYLCFGSMTGTDLSMTNYRLCL